MHVEEKKVIRNSKHGCTKGKSCLNNLASLYEEWDTKMIRKLEYFLHEIRRSLFLLLSLEKIEENLINVYKYLMDRCQEDGATLLSVVLSNRVRGNPHKLETWSSVRIWGQTSLTVTEHWNGLARKAVESPTLEPFKTHLHTIPCMG